jgi:hypothetical protein
MPTLVEYDALWEEIRKSVHNLGNAEAKLNQAEAAATTIVTNNPGIVSQLDTVNNDERVSSVIDARATIAGVASRKTALVGKINSALSDRQAVIDALNAEPTGDEDIDQLKRLVNAAVAIANEIKTRLQS